MKKFSQKQHLQHDSTKLDAVGRQVDFLGENLDPTPIADSLIYSQPSRLAAFRLAQIAGGKEDKYLYGSLGIDKGTWSRIKDGDANFPMNKWFQYQRLCTNVIPLQYDAYHLGFELVPLRSDLERRVAELEAQLAQERHDREVEREYERRMRAP